MSIVKLAHRPAALVSLNRIPYSGTLHTNPRHVKQTLRPMLAMLVFNAIFDQAIYDVPAHLLQAEVIELIKGELVAVIHVPIIFGPLQKRCRVHRDNGAIAAEHVTRGAREHVVR